MYNFWLIAILLFLLASLFIIVPCYRFIKSARANRETVASEAAAEKERISQNILIYKERLAEIEEDKASGRIDLEEYTQLKEELDNTLVEDAEEVSVYQPSHPTSSTSTVWLIASVCIMVTVAVSLAFYERYGAYDKVVNFINNEGEGSRLAQATEQARNGDMTALLEQLHAKLKENPDNLEGWSLLARTAMNTERFDLAVDAFNQVIRLIKSNPELDNHDLAASYGILAQAQYYAANGSMSKEVKETIDTALTFNPNEPNTLSLLAITAFTQGEFEAAINHWQKVLAAYPNHPATESMKQGINEAQKRAGLELTDFTDKEGTPSIRVSVSLDKSLDGKVEEGDTVFVFIKDASIGDAPSPPLAASRHTVSELPFEIILSDQNAMSPMAKLSDAKSVNVVARVSKTGSVSATKNDIEGRVERLTVGGQSSANIVIDTVVQ